MKNDKLDFIINEELLLFKHIAKKMKCKSQITYPEYILKISKLNDKNTNYLTKRKKVKSLEQTIHQKKIYIWKISFCKGVQCH